MGKIRQSAKTVILMIMLLMLILDSKTAIHGAQEGIRLCLQAAIPSLFPAMIISDLMIRNMRQSRIPLISNFFEIMHLPQVASPYFLAGAISGYPTGAKLIGQAYKEGALTKKSAENALYYCSNIGPAFVLGICSPAFSDHSFAIALWIIHILSALLVGLLVSSGSCCGTGMIQHQKRSITEVIKDCTKSMGYISGWIVLFRVTLQFLSKWFLWMFSAEIAVILSGLLELTNGCTSLGSISNEQLRFITCSVILACSGLSIVMQTTTFLKGLSILPYLKGKCIQSVFSIIMSIIFLYALNIYASHLTAIFAISLFFIIISFLILLFKKHIDFPEQMIYNTKKSLKR